jgi:hypothetical protein
MLLLLIVLLNQYQLLDVIVNNNKVMETLLNSTYYFFYKKCNRIKSRLNNIIEDVHNDIDYYTEWIVIRVLTLIVIGIILCMFIIR